MKCAIDKQARAEEIGKKFHPSKTCNNLDDTTDAKNNLSLLSAGLDKLATEDSKGRGLQISLSHDAISDGRITPGPVKTRCETRMAGRRCCREHQLMTQYKGPTASSQ